MTGPSSVPRGEHAPTREETRLVGHGETVVDTDHDEHISPRPNRATRRAMQRAARRK
jgi:hypothetical protein